MPIPAARLAHTRQYINASCLRVVTNGSAAL
jgi:hypothetical protein